MSCRLTARLERPGAAVEGVSEVDPVLGARQLYGLLHLARVLVEPVQQIPAATALIQVRRLLLCRAARSEASVPFIIPSSSIPLLRQCYPPTPPETRSDGRRPR